MTLRTNTRVFLLSVTAASLLMSGCSDKVLDFRNAEINNGKVYAGGADTPFSGSVTNVSFSVIFDSRSGFRSLFGVVSTIGRSATISDTGTNSICSAHAHDGLLDGKVTCTAPQSDIVRIEAKFDDGALDGAFTIHNETGDGPAVDASFKNDAPDGKMTVYSSKTGKPIHVVSWDGGVLSGEEEAFDETTGNRILHATFANGKYEGEFTRYAPDGKQVIYQADFAQGQHDGDEESFDPQTGKMTGQAHYANGKLDGVVRHWNADGSLLDEKTYQNGVDVAAAKAASDAAAAAEKMRQHEPQDIEACVNKTREEVTQKNGGFAPPMAMAEWTDDCTNEIEAKIKDIAMGIPSQPVATNPAPANQ